ncbi:MAG: tRNA pseudouridine(38-40) synthase TruA [Mycoplasmataceae bacterium]|jgi:tRNA pseudouridine38-40 synthase|nr:tRNA pseudouridine(38-40) synthase TruA [Mycoplasmataceae bacterium]
MNYKLTITYDGSNYHGWAIQPDVITIQATIEKVLNQLFDTKYIITYCSGRTDAFVHALQQVVNFSNKKEFPLDKLKISLNKLLPLDIRVLNAEKADERFHARFSAVSKTYVYKIYNGLENEAFKHKYYLVYNKKINLPLLKKASKLLVGSHDFLSFSISDIKETVRTINYIKFKRNKKYIDIYVNGSGFLRGMVRMIVGTLIDINEGRKQVEDINKFLKNPKKGSVVSKARASGLYLYKVLYRNEK